MDSDISAVNVRILGLRHLGTAAMPDFKWVSLDGLVVVRFILRLRLKQLLSLVRLWLRLRRLCTAEVTVLLDR